MNKYFSFDVLDVPPLQFHKTEDEARTRAEKSMAEERDNAGEGWSPEAVDNPICWGVVRQCMTETMRRKLTPEERRERGFDELVDYDLRDVS